MQSASARKPEAKASLWVAGLCFAVAAFVLCHSAFGPAVLLALSCGFSLLFVRLRQERDEGDARLGLSDQLTWAKELLGRGAHRQALYVAQRVAEAAQSAPIQRQALELAAWCHLGLGRPQAARNALSWVGGAGGLNPWLDVYCCAAVEDACGASSWALHLLERAARKRPLSREATLFRLDLHARLRSVEAACALAWRERARLTAEDLQQVLEFAKASGHARAAQALGRALESSNKS